MDSLARKAAQQERDSKYEEFWRSLSRAGDPARIPNKVRTGYNAGWDAAESALAPMREALQALSNAMHRMLTSFANQEEDLCMECGEKQGSGEGCDTCYVIGEAEKALARAAEVLKGEQ